MAEYSESTKQNIGDIVLQIHDLEIRLAELKRKGEALVVPLRAVADVFDSGLQDDISLVLAKDDFFATSHSSRGHRERVRLEGKGYPAYDYPSGLKELLLEIFETEEGIRQLERALQHTKQRAYKS